MLSFSKPRQFGLCSSTCQCDDVSEYLRMVDSKLFNHKVLLLPLTSTSTRKAPPWSTS